MWEWQGSACGISTGSDARLMESLSSQLGQVTHVTKRALGDTVMRASLPGAAQRWLDAALPQDWDLPASVQLEQEGTI